MIFRIGLLGPQDTEITVRTGSDFQPSMFFGNDSISIQIDEGCFSAMSTLSIEEATALGAELCRAASDARYKRSAVKAS